MAFDLSVIVCAHNPPSDSLARALDGLHQQTLPTAAWELVLLDNASSEPIAARFDISWHPHGRCVLEPALGLTRARVRGIQETAGPLIVFVDADNVLAGDFLERALEISATFPFLGAWGGAVLGEFEVEPPVWAKPYLGWLALRDPAHAHWSNSTLITDSVPCGAGICVRRHVAATWAARVTTDPIRLALGRIGRGLGAGEDGDLAFTACDLGLGTGVFPSLRLTHLIPAERLTLDYLERLVEEMARTEVLLRSLRHPIAPPPHRGRISRALAAILLIRLPRSNRRLLRAADRGRRAGHDAVLAAPTL